MPIPTPVAGGRRRVAHRTLLSTLCIAVIGALSLGEAQAQSHFGSYGGMEGGGRFQGGGYPGRGVGRGPGRPYPGPVAGRPGRPYPGPIASPWPGRPGRPYPGPDAGPRPGRPYPGPVAGHWPSRPYPPRSYPTYPRPYPGPVWVDTGPDEDEVVRPVRRPRPRPVIVEVDEPAPPRKPVKVRPARPPVEVDEPEPVKAVKPRSRPQPVQVARPEPKAEPVRVARPQPRPEPVKVAARPAPAAVPERAARVVRTPRAVPPPPPATVAAAPRAVSGVPAADETRYVPGEVLFTTSDADTGAAIGRSLRLTPVSSTRIELIGAHMNRYRIGDRRDVASVVRALERNSRVLAAQPNYIFTLAGAAPSTPVLAAAQYAVAKIHAPEAHRLALGDRTRVAIIDSGIDAEHKELKGAVADSLDEIGGPPEPHAHGTAIAGIVGARSDLMGVAPRTELLAIRAFSASAAKPGAQGTTAHVVVALDWAHAKAARVVNMSFGGPADPLLAQTITAAHAKGMILVAAAGNEGPAAKPVYPAAEPHVIAVTATDADDKRLAVANRGAYVALAAPGSEILVAAPAGAYTYSSGTSMAAAHVSGVAALMLSERPELSAGAVREVLNRTARDLGSPGRDDDFGAGLSDAMAAVAAVADGPGVSKVSLAPTADLESGQVQASEPQPATVTATAPAASVPATVTTQTAPAADIPLFPQDGGPVAMQPTTPATALSAVAEAAP